MKAVIGMGAIGIIVALVAGWVTNLAWLFSNVDNGFTARFVIGLVGVFVAPLGGIHGITLWF